MHLTDPYAGIQKYGRNVSFPYKSFKGDDRKGQHLILSSLTALVNFTESLRSALGFQKHSITNSNPQMFEHSLCARHGAWRLVKNSV